MRAMPPRPQSPGAGMLKRPQIPLKKPPDADSGEKTGADSKSKIPPRPMTNKTVTSYRFLFGNESAFAAKPAPNKSREPEAKGPEGIRIPPRPLATAKSVGPSAQKPASSSPTPPPTPAVSPVNPAVSPAISSPGPADAPSALKKPRTPPETKELRDVGMMGASAASDGLEKHLETMEKTPNIPGLIIIAPKPIYKSLSKIGFRSGVPMDKLTRNMVQISGGRFPFGPNGKAVEIGPFYIDKYPVTNELYRQFVDTVGVEPPPDWIDGHYIHGTGDYPVTMINFAEAQAYARWAGKRLPTEKEWERAARGPGGFKYPWGNEFDPAKAHFDKDYGCFKKVYSFPDGISPEGCADMMGNANEWVVSDDDHKKPLIRGGSFIENYSYIKAYTRMIPGERARSAYVGFRCATGMDQAANASYDL